MKKIENMGEQDSITSVAKRSITPVHFGLAEFGDDD